MNLKPYIGLRAFEADEVEIFFGREKHTDELIECLRHNHFLAVIGTSGCGKSSLVKTGLIAGLKAGYLATTGSYWRIVDLRPSQKPFYALAEKLLSELADILNVDYTVETLEQALRQNSLSLHEILARYSLPNHAQLLIICDQFEEIFRFQKQATDETRNFVSLLLASSQPYRLQDGQISHSIYVVMTMRSDFLGDCSQFAGLAEAINQGLYLTPRLNAEQLRAAIEEPAWMFEWEVEATLVTQLLEEAEHNQDQLPLLQHVLMRLWNLKNVEWIEEKSSSPATIIRLEDYQNEKIQTLKNALSTHADEAFNELTDNQKPIARQIFCRLTSAETDKADTRNPTKVKDLMVLTGQSLAQLKAVLKPFRQSGRCFLLPSEEVELNDDSVIDITHESLIRNWKRLDTWTKEEAESAEIYKRLEQNALLNQKKEHGFYRTPELETTLAWKEKYKPNSEWASRYGQHFELAMRFLTNSQQKQTEYTQQKEREEQYKLRQKQAIYITLITLLAISGMTLWTWLSNTRLEKEKTHLEEERIQLYLKLFNLQLGVAFSATKVEDYAEAKKVLAETYKRDNQVSSSLRHARNLLASFTEIKGGEAQQVYQGSDYALLTVAISPNGKLLAAGGEYGTLILFDVESGKLLQRLEGHATEGSAQDTAISSIAFTPSGQQLISASADKKIIIWQRQQNSGSATDPSNGLFKKQRELAAPAGVNAIAISPDGKLLASGGDDNNITLWELSSGKKLNTLKKHSKGISVRGLAFSPNGHYLASASYDDTTTIWLIEKIEKIKPLHVLPGSVNQIAFSADSQTIATAGQDNTIRLWDVSKSKQNGVLAGHQNAIFAVSWVGDYVVSGSADRSIRLWDSRSIKLWDSSGIRLRDNQKGGSLRVLQGHEAGVQDFALYGGSLWSASNDGTVRRWSLSLPFQQAWVLPSEPLSTVITPALNHVAVGFNNGDLHLYDMQHTEPVWQKHSAHSKSIGRLTVNRDGSLLASGSDDTTAKIWHIQNTANGIALINDPKALTGHKKPINSLAFSPDAKTLATAGYDGQIGLFSIPETKPAYFIPADKGIVKAVEFDNTGTHLLSSGQDRTLKLWDLKTHPPSPKNFPFANDTILWSSISPDNKTVVSVGREFAVNIYDSQSTTQLYHLTGHDSSIYRAIFAPDSQQIATVSADGTAKFWELGQGKELFSLRLPANAYPPVPFWDFDFRCLKEKCLLAVPLVRGQLQLYQLAYEGKLTANAEESKRQQLEMWRLYLNTVDTLLQTNAPQPAAQALHEAKEIGEKVRKLAPNGEEVQKESKREQELEAKLITINRIK